MDNELVYKYRTWSNQFHRDSFLHNKLYFASPADVNDPFDFRISHDYSLLDTPEKVSSYVDRLITDGLPTMIKNKIDPIDKRNELISRLKFDKQSLQDEYDNHYYKWVENRFGVVSFSKRWDSILMWSHYAENHKGFCIGYKKSRLESSGIYGTAGAVHYNSNYPSLDPLKAINREDSIAQSHTKAEDWRYEEEYRLTKLWSEKDPNEDDRITVIPGDLISEVILGVQIASSQKKTIIEIARRKKINIFQIVQERHKFVLNRLPL